MQNDFLGQPGADKPVFLVALHTYGPGLMGATLSGYNVYRDAPNLTEQQFQASQATGLPLVWGHEFDPTQAAGSELGDDASGRSAMYAPFLAGVPAVYPEATSLACQGGRFVAVGSPRGTVNFNFLKDIHLREISIVGARQPKTPNHDHIYYRFTKDRERALVMRLMATGRLPLDQLITHEFAPEECQSVYTILANNPKNVLGVLFRWNRN